MNRQSDMPGLFQTICASFCVITVVSNILSAKMVPLPMIHLAVPAGLITYPLALMLCGLATELFGAIRARQMVFLALGMNILSLLLIQLSLLLPSTGQTEEAFQSVMGLSSLRIFASLSAYLTSQLTEIKVYTMIRQTTGSRFLWLRSNGATFAAQLADTVIVDLIALWWGLNMPLDTVAMIMALSFVYKTSFNLICTPLYYLLVYGLPQTKEAAINSP